jgi:hypothetical protein
MRISLGWFFCRFVLISRTGWRLKYSLCHRGKIAGILDLTRIFYGFGRVYRGGRKPFLKSGAGTEISGEVVPPGGDG